jgi:transcriptional regulator with XRE-family HTH domain
MNLGDRLMELRKSKHLSQEEVAEKINVSRQTISKWETNQSTPDFDKIIPLCELFEISTEELITGNKIEKEVVYLEKEDEDIHKEKRTKGLVYGIISFFIAVAWIMISIPVLRFNPVVSSAIFLLICGIGTCIIVYSMIVYKKPKEKKKENKVYKRIESALAILFTFIYLGLSFATMAWHVTWMLWIMYALALEIIKLFFALKGEEIDD